MTAKELEKFTNGTKYPRGASPFGNKCVACGEEMHSYDNPEEWDYSKRRGGNYVFIHKKCVRNAWAGRK